MAAARSFRAASGQAPGGREMGPPASVYVDVDGESIWACHPMRRDQSGAGGAGGRFGIDCLGPTTRSRSIDTIFKFDSKGNVVKSFGRGMFIWPHGLHVDRDGNVWVTDARRPAGGRDGSKGRSARRAPGRQVQPGRKSADDARRSGRSGGAISTTSSRRARSSVAAPNGDIFVADGHESTRTTAS